MKRRVWVSVFSLIALGAAGVSAWHMFRGVPETLKPLLGAPATATIGAVAASGSSAAAAPSTGAPAAANPTAGAGGPGAGKPAGGPGGPGGPAAMPVPVEVITVSASPVDDEALSVGTLRSNESVMLRSEVAGRVLNVGFTDGSAVSKGAVLLKLDDSVARAEVSQAKAELGLAMDNLRRVQDLKEKDFVSSSALDQASAARDVAAAKLELAEARLQRFAIVAPFAGMVGLRNVTPGDYIKEGADVVALEDLSSMRLDFRLPERLNPYVRPGSRLIAGFEAFPGRDFPAQVVAVDPQIDPAGRSMLIRARLPNPGSQLKPGMLARINLNLGQRKGVILIPEAAIVPQGGDTFVYRVVDGKAVKTLVQLGVRRPGQVEIAAGLQPGEKVVVAGQIRINRDQAPVRVVGEPS